MQSSKTIVIADRSEIIVSGIKELLSNLNWKLIEMPLTQDFKVYIEKNEADLVIVNPELISGTHYLNLKDYENDKKAFHWVGLVYSYQVPSVLEQFDELIHINDSRLEVKKKIDKLFQVSKKIPIRKDKDKLSEREKEVLRCIVKGLSNKEIADELIISVHTVVSHRKNLTSKTGIKSPSGLTVYAILNQIITAEELERDLIEN